MKERGDGLVRENGTDSGIDEMLDTPDEPDESPETSVGEQDVGIPLPPMRSPGAREAVRPTSITARASATFEPVGRSVAAARAFVRVLDLWDRIGDRTQRWQNLRYVARLLRRLGSADDAAELFAVLESANEQASITPRASLGVGPAIRIQPTAVLRARAMLDRLG